MAIATKMSSSVQLFHCSIRQPWLSFAPRILPRFGRNIIWEKTFPDLKKPPKLIISCGRRMAAVGKFYKRKTKAKHIQILNPGDNPKKYDVLICPEHDRLTASNIISTKGSLHAITEKYLYTVKNSSENKFLQPEKIICLMLGNPARNFFETLVKLHNNIRENFPGFSLIICASRRTPKKHHDRIRQVFSEAHLIWFNEQDGKNPYLNLLASAHVFLVTADSINMMSETCATNKPVVALAKEFVSPKHQAFIQSLDFRLSTLNQLNTNDQPLTTVQSVVDQLNFLLSH
jgi:mitochondrial fission protein ELM1